MKIPEKIPEFLFSIRLTPKRSLVSVLVVSLLTFLTVRCGINQEDILKIYNEIRKGIKFNLPKEVDIINEFDRQLNERINKDPELLKFKIKTEVTDAISKYEKETNDYGNIKLPSPRYFEKPIDTSLCYTNECKLLGGEMRLCAPWYEGCPSTFPTDTKDLTGDEESDSINKSVREQTQNRNEPGKFKF